jgi:hypothetical protein
MRDQRIDIELIKLPGKLARRFPVIIQFNIQLGIDDRVLDR